MKLVKTKTETEIHTTWEEDGWRILPLPAKINMSSWNNLSLEIGIEPITIRRIVAIQAALTNQTVHIPNSIVFFLLVANDIKPYKISGSSDLSFYFLLSFVRGKTSWENHFFSFTYVISLPSLFHVGTNLRTWMNVTKCLLLVEVCNYNGLFCNNTQYGRMVWAYVDLLHINRRRVLWPQK